MDEDRPSRFLLCCFRLFWIAGAVGIVSWYLGFRFLALGAPELMRPLVSWSPFRDTLDAVVSVLIPTAAALFILSAWTGWLVIMARGRSDDTDYAGKFKYIMKYAAISIATCELVYWTIYAVLSLVDFLGA